MANKFIILRKDGDDYRSIGPLAHPLPLEEARAEIAALAARYPHQQFHLFADVGGAIRHETIALNLQAPSVDVPAPAGVRPIGIARAA